MEAYVAVVSSHGKPKAVHVFDSEHDARHFAQDLKTRESWEDKSKDAIDHGDHKHDSTWLEDWGDEDGCGVVVGKANEEHGHHH